MAYCDDSYYCNLPSSPLFNYVQVKFVSLLFGFLLLFFYIALFIFVFIVVFYYFAVLLLFLLFLHDISLMNNESQAGARFVLSSHSLTGIYMFMLAS